MSGCIWEVLFKHFLSCLVEVLTFGFVRIYQSVIVDLANLAIDQYLMSVDLCSFKAFNKPLSLFYGLTEEFVNNFSCIDSG